MRTTFTISGNVKCGPFEIFAQDVDEVIMLINFYLRIGKENPEKLNSQPRAKNGVIRVKVNDNTASGGWF